MICHFNDLICPVFLLSYSNLLLITVNKEIRRLKWLMMLGISSGLVWEFVAPIIKTTSTTDAVDLFFYTLGSGLYWCIIRLFPNEV